MNPDERSGIRCVKSKFSVDETVRRIENILRGKGIKLFILIDHSGEAAKESLKMPNTKLLIFGNPKAGTPIMLSSPSAAIDLPLKLLVSEDVGGTVWVSYSSSDYLRAKHDIPEGVAPPLDAVERLASEAAGTSQDYRNL